MRGLFAGTSSWYVSVHSGQLSLLPSAGWEPSTSQGTVAMLCVWEGNRRPDVALAMCHKLCDMSIYRHNGQRKGDEHLRWYNPLRNMALFTLFCCKCMCWLCNFGNHRYQQNVNSPQKLLYLSPILFVNRVSRTCSDLIL